MVSNTCKEENCDGEVWITDEVYPVGETRVSGTGECQECGAIYEMEFDLTEMKWLRNNSRARE